jgi:hypothetical protein
MSGIADVCLDGLTERPLFGTADAPARIQKEKDRRVSERLWAEFSFVRMQSDCKPEFSRSLRDSESKTVRRLSWTAVWG